MKDEHRDNTSSKVLQFLSQADELDVNERILIAIFCKAGVSVPYSLHQDAEMNVNYSINTCKIAKNIVGTYAEMNNYLPGL